MLTALIVIIGLSVIILTHEAGHYFAARAFNLKVHEFGFGFPPRLLSFRKYKDASGKVKLLYAWGARELPDTLDGMVAAETAISINILPMGGFVRIAGENDHMDEEGNVDEASLSLEDKKRYLSSQSAWKKIVVMAAGVTVNFLTGWLLISTIFMMGSPRVLLISGVAERSPAAVAGLRDGDVIQGFAASDQFVPYIADRQGKEVSLKILRGGSTINVSVKPEWNEEVKRATIGVSLTNAGFERRGFFESIGAGFVQSFSLAKEIFAGFGSLLAGIVTKGKLQEGVVGPVGIFSIAQQSGALGMVYVFQLLAVIAINLAALNLVPFPALDGGRILFAVIEKLKGSPLPRKAEVAANMTGFFLLICLMVVLTARDIFIRWFS